MLTLIMIMILRPQSCICWKYAAKYATYMHRIFH